MTDIVERLRQLAAVDNCQASIEAASEIERLRNDLHLANEWAATVYAGQERDAAEITRLRAALEKHETSFNHCSEMLEQSFNISMIDKSKQYRTRDGREVRIYAVDGCNGHRIHGAIYYGEANGGWQHRAWFPDGRMHNTNSACDLIEVKPRIQREVWVNVYPTCVFACLTRNYADAIATNERIACVRLTIDCEEGDGL